VLAFGALLGAAMSVPASAFATSNAQTQVQPTSNPGRVDIALRQAPDYVTEGQQINLQVAVSGATGDVVQPSIKLDLATACSLNLAPSGTQDVLRAGQTRVWDCQVKVPVSATDPISLRATFTGYDATDAAAYSVPKVLDIKVAHPSLQLVSGTVTKDTNIDATRSEVVVTWRLQNNGNVPVSAMIANVPTVIDQGATVDVPVSYDDAVPGQPFQRPLTVQYVDILRRGPSLAAGPLTSEPHTASAVTQGTDTPTAPTVTVPSLPIFTGGGEPSDTDTVDTSPIDTPTTTRATVPAVQPVLTPSSQAASTTGATTPSSAVTTTTGTLETTQSGEAGAAAPTTTTPTTQAANDEPLTGGAPPATTGATPTSGVSGDETGLGAGNVGGANSLSWSTRVATIAGGALFGLALAGFGWVYVSATQGIGRVRRKP
jgi:hypothetical protein